jgi:uncharacterized protein (TIGR02596 family)
MIDINSSFRPAFRRRKGFSLVELLTVMAIIGVLATVSMTGFASLMSSNHLNEATAVVQGQLELARQTAKTLNRSVQLRLYQDNNNTSGTPSIDSMQVVVPAEASTTESDQPVEKPILLPQNVIIADSSSDLLLAQLPAGSGNSYHPFNPPIPANYTNCYILTFSTTGAITTTNNTGNLVSPTSNNGTVYWLLSLVSQNQYRAGGSSASVGKGEVQNYATFYLNSVNGTYSCTRP